MRQHTWKTEDAEFVASQSEGESVIEFKETGKTFWENECSFEIGSCVDELIRLSSALTASEKRVKKLEAQLKDFADCGTRHDLNPTCGPVMNEGCVDGYGPGGQPYDKYIKSMDTYVRNRAKTALEVEE